MLKNLKICFIAVALGLSVAACENDKPKEEKKLVEPTIKRLEGVKVPSFNADSAYNFIVKQVAFGPRVPNTKEHRNTASYLTEKLKEFGAEVQTQNFEATAFDGTKLYLQNIIASYNPAAKKRILLAAHWDTRPFADKDPEKGNWKAPIEGANDGASGVGVLLEIARQIGLNEDPHVGIDIILFDGEDYGEPEFMPETDKDRSKIYWCLGSQYWATNKHVPGYSAYYGILLDMVGAKDAMFYQEGYSRKVAPSVLKNVWAWGNELGHGRYFKYANADEIVDDHVFMIKAGVPSIDIIEYDPTSDFYFGPYHHTIKDNMDIISKETLKAVGETVMHVIYNEPAPQQAKLQ